MCTQVYTDLCDSRLEDSGMTGHSQNKHTNHASHLVTCSDVPTLLGRFLWHHTHFCITSLFEFVNLIKPVVRLCNRESDSRRHWIMEHLLQDFLSAATFYVGDSDVFWSTLGMSEGLFTYSVSVVLTETMSPAVQSQWEKTISVLRWILLVLQILLTTP